MSPLQTMLEDFAAHASTRRALLQLAAIAFALGIGWLASSVLRRRVAQQALWKFGAGGFDRVAFPLTALALLWGVRFGLRKFVPGTPAVDLAVSLLVAFAVIRLAVYVLRHILPDGAFLRGSERTIAITMWAGVALHLTGVLPEVWEALDAIAFTIGKQRVSLLLILQGVLSVAVTLAISMWVARAVEERVLATERLELSTRVVVAKLIRAFAFFVAILVALPLVGIDLTALSVFSGALGVGLGLGLQKIASNYVSGFIILLDRSIRIGDLVTVDNRQGVVKAIESRYTVIRSLDGTESIIPNDTMITQAVTNHSFTDPKVVVKVAVTVGYGSDIDQVTAILVAAARKQPRVLAEPAPSAWIIALGDNGIEMESGFWVADPDQGLAALRGAVLRDVLEACRTQGIEIPFPKRDVTLIPATPPQTSQ